MPSYYGEGESQSLLWVEGVHGASFEGVAPWSSSVGERGACWDAGVVAHGVEENVACGVVGVPEDAVVELFQAVHQGDHRKGVGCFLEDHLEVHLPGYLFKIQNTILIKKKQKIFSSTRKRQLGIFLSHDVIFQVFKKGMTQKVCSVFKPFTRHY